ncbi:MAG: hypothetical protein SGCHY_001909 [Lobulomycetales sp.]
MSKALPCKFFQRGTCGYSEEECSFSHSNASKRQVCPFFLRGTCRYGNDCALKHSRKPSSSSRAAAPSIPKPLVKAHTLAPAGSAGIGVKGASSVGFKGSSSVDIKGSSSVGVKDSSSADNKGSSGSHVKDEPAATRSTDENFSVRKTRETFSDLVKGSDLDSELDLVNLLPSSMEEVVMKPGQSREYTSAEQEALLRPWVMATEHTKEALNWKSKASNSVEKSLCPFHYQKSCRFRDKCRYVHGEECPKCHKNCILPNDPEYREEHLASCSANQTIPAFSALSLSSNSNVQSIFAEEARKIIDESKEKDCVVCMEKVFEKTDPRFGLLSIVAIDIS